MKALQDDKLREVLDRIPALAPVTFLVNLNGAIAVHLISEAMVAGCKPETLIAEAVRAYLGDA